MTEKIVLTLLNGKEVDLSLNFNKLALLKKVKNGLYQRYNSVMMNQKKDMDIFDMPFVLYIAYWCANFEVGKEIYEVDEFISLVPFDFGLIKGLFQKLTTPKKNKNLEIHS